MLTRKCRRCKQLKEITDFTRRAKGVEKYRPNCKVCRNIEAQERRDNEKRLCPDCIEWLRLLLEKYDAETAMKHLDVMNFMKNHTCPHQETDREWLDRTREERRQRTFAIVERNIKANKAKREKRLEYQRKYYEGKKFRLDANSL